MPYTDLQTLINAATEETLINLTNETTSVNTDMVNQCIQFADAKIDAMLMGAVTSWPLAETPSIIKYIATEYAICNLYNIAYGAGSSRYEEGILKGIQYRMERADKQLEMFQKKLMVLEDTTEKSSLNGYVSSPDQVFTDETMGKW